ncbi:hypothetical protein TrLO_g360 [Triparma laevis f. longispina]|uniref:Tubulin-specific chaperone A n=2 Tax=Triparma laevis TaxID=1534972 RepID=A0A9W7CGS6_9STRA|nr:hypothetical protein TrLO_g360 [Triparma laevis f. longispina]
MPKKPTERTPAEHLKIKTKTCQRMGKEVGVYEKEVVDNSAKLQKMEADGADPYDIKAFKEILAESVMMVPDSKGRLAKTVEDLSLFVDTSKDLEGVKESEWWAIAQEILGVGEVVEKKEETNVEGLAEDEAF